MNKIWLKKIYHRFLSRTPVTADYAFRISMGGLLRTTTRSVHGHGHVIRVHRSAVLKHVIFDIDGQGHRIEIAPLCVLRNVRFRVVGSNNHIMLNQGVRFNLGGCVWMEDQGGEIQIGARTTFEESHLAVTGIGRRIVIGEDCMFSGDIDVRTGDSHALVDLRGNKLNPEQDVIINNHVWVASHCSILKGAQLGAGSIVATHSTVTRVFKEDNLLVGGSPASKLKEGISWTRQRFPSIPGN